MQELARYLDDREACSACYGSLIHALGRLNERGELSGLEQKIRIGQGIRNQTPSGIGVGSCTKNSVPHLEGYPLRPNIVDFVKKYC